MGIYGKDKIGLKAIKEKRNPKQLNQCTAKLKWCWTGHVYIERKETEKWTRTFTVGYHRESSRSRQPKRWEDGFKKVAGPEWLCTTKDRNK